MNCVCAFVIGMLVALAPAMAAELRSVEADRTEFKVTMSDGRVLRSRELVGAVLTVGIGTDTMRLRIEGVERDPDAKRGDIWLHTISTQAANGAWVNLCAAGSDGRRQAFPIAGRARRPDGLVEPAQPDVFELTCTAGAQGKCVRFGYLPWEGTAMLAHYNACIRMVRADYCGDGTPHTRDGTLIDMFDKVGVQRDEPGDDLNFEAAWAPTGAVCVRRVRISEIFSLDALRAQCPRFKPEDLGERCTEERSTADPAALLMNKSIPK